MENNDVRVSVEKISKKNNRLLTACPKGKMPEESSNRLLIKDIAAVQGICENSIGGFDPLEAYDFARVSRTIIIHMADTPPLETYDFARESRS